MPNQPRFPVRGFRLPDDLWDALRRIADDRGETVTDVVVRVLWTYVREYPANERRPRR